MGSRVCISRSQLIASREILRGGAQPRGNLRFIVSLCARTSGGVGFMVDFVGEGR